MEDGAGFTSDKAQRRAARRKQRTDGHKHRIYSPLKPLNETQRFFMECLRGDDQVFAIGGAGTGKTYIATRHAARRLAAGEVEKLYVARPTISLPGHRLGFLPGGSAQKLKPWLVPIVEAIVEEISAATYEQFTNQGKIEVVSFEHIRGRTLKNAVIILDEAQNCTLHDLRTFLTRVGEDAQIIVCGDTDQCDIPNSGLEKVVDMIEEDGIDAAIVEFDDADVVRSAITKAWVKAFSKRKPEQCL